MKFSIVMPAYNASNYLEACVASVKAQTYSEWELLAIDDGSTDDTLSKLEQFATADRRIRIFHQENSGQFCARQRGIEAATGEYLLFLDSDDALEENCLLTVYEALKEKKWDMLLFTGAVILPNETVKRRFGQMGTEKKSIPVQSLRENIISSHDMNSLCIKAIRRELFDGDDGDYSVIKGVGCAEDKVRLLYPLTKAKQICYIPDCLYRYYYREQSVIHRFTTDKIPLFLTNQMFSILQAYMRIWSMTGKEYQHKMELYYIRNYLSVYFKMRKQCKAFREWKMLRRFPWKQHLNEEVIRHIPALRKQLTRKERLKLLVAQMRL